MGRPIASNTGARDTDPPHDAPEEETPTEGAEQCASLLWQAVHAGDLPQVKGILEEAIARHGDQCIGFLLDEPDEDGDSTALLEAVTNGKAEIVEALLRAGASTEVDFASGQTSPLWEATRCVLRMSHELTVTPERGGASVGHLPGMLDGVARRPSVRPSVCLSVCLSASTGRLAWTVLPARLFLCVRCINSSQAREQQHGGAAAPTRCPS